MFKINIKSYFKASNISMVVYFNDYVATIRRDVGVKYIQKSQKNCNVVFMS